VNAEETQFSAVIDLFELPPHPIAFVSLLGGSAFEVWPKLIPTHAVEEICSVLTGQQYEIEVDFGAANFGPPLAVLDASPLVMGILEDLTYESFDVVLEIILCSTASASAAGGR